ncbi:hypothetical protein [Mycoplasma seminis]|uniref:LPXTG cell wall anchor domain-containing protein n=1 Tax=Mycoplasma seminis TaxID=512749 RepID=A0ABY9H9J2_9MOLU|nr:hypothetical protein [Mycoplasma seminis]WLP85166.1 hypothetical protein Q8852_02465 [Mycoplasma seminis]
MDSIKLETILSEINNIKNISLTEQPIHKPQISTDKTNNSNHNLNYLYFLFLIPIIGIIIFFIVYKRKKDRAK